MRAVFGPRTVALAVLLGLVACSRPPRPEIPAAASGARTEADARAALERSEHETRTLTALFRMTVRKADGATETNRAALAVARPDRLRLQVFSLGVMTVYDYTVDGDRFRVRRPLDGVDRLGRVDGTEAKDAPEWDLRPLFLRPSGSGAARIEDGGGHWLAAIGPAEEGRIVTITKADGRLTRETLLRGGRPWLEARYLDFRPVDGALLPFRIQIDWPATRVAVVVEVTRYTRNQPIAEETFRF